MNAEVPRSGAPFRIGVRFQVFADVDDDRGHLDYAAQIIKAAIWQALAEHGYMDADQTSGPVLAAEGHATPTVVTGEVDTIPVLRVVGEESES